LIKKSHQEQLTLVFKAWFYSSRLKLAICAVSNVYKNILLIPFGVNQEEGKDKGFENC